MLPGLRLGLGLIVLTLPFSLGQTRIAKANRPPTPSMPGLDNPFVVGEQLNYDASWRNFILAGAMTVRTKERRVVDSTEAYHVAIQAQSVGLVRSFIYEVDDIYESFINTTTLRPFRAENRVNHGNKQKQTSLMIDTRRQIARLADGRTIKIPPDTYDLASLLYAFRTIDLVPGRVRTFTLLEDNDLHPVRAEPEAGEKVSIRTTEYAAFRIAIKLIEGQDSNDLYKVRLYLSNDSRRLPVLLTAEPPWGQIRVELTSATGTKPTG